MVLARVGVNMVEWHRPNGYHQSHMPRCSPSCTMPPQKVLQDQQVVLTHVSFKLLTSLELRLSEILCAPFENGVSVYKVSCFLECKPPWFSKPDILGVYLTKIWSWCGSWNPCPLEKDLYGCDIPPVCRWRTSGYGSQLDCISPPLTCLVVAPSLYL